MEESEKQRAKRGEAEESKKQQAKRGKAATVVAKATQ